MKKTFRDTVCVVTGAGKGLGLAMCAGMAADGAIVVMADVDESAMTESAKQLALEHPSASIESHHLDVTDRVAFAQLIEQILTDHGRIDYLVNNAGINTMGDFRDLTSEIWERIVNVNLWGVVHGTELAYAQMAKQGSGHIVNIASGLGLVPAPRNIPYSTTKFAVVGLSESLRIEGKDLGVNVSVVCPGWISTPQVENGSVVLGGDTKDMNGSADSVHIADAAKTIPIPMLTAEKSAQTILRGVLRNKARIVFPGYVRWTSRLYKWCAPLADLWFRYEIRSFRELRDGKK